MCRVDIRILALNPPDLFIILRTIVANARKLPESVHVGPFDDKLLIENGVWMRGADLDVVKAIKVIEKQVKALKDPVHFVWSPEPLVHPEGSVTEALEWFDAKLIVEDSAAAIKAWDKRGRKEPEATTAIVSTGGTAASRTLYYNPDTKKWDDPEGELPSHIASIRIPPAWKNVRYDPNPNAALHVTGEDSKGRRQAIYNKEFVQQQAAAKFARVHELNTKFNQIQDEVQSDLRGPHKEEAATLRLIMHTGIRPGSESDTGGAVKAYGATTLEGRHVIGNDYHNVRLSFVGKKGVSIDVPVDHLDTAKDLLRRRKKSGDNGKLFGTSAGKLLSYTQSKDGGGFKTKDIRTLLATRLANRLVSKMKKPKTGKEYKKSLRVVAKSVAEKLGNTPAVALSAYINPSVFAHWTLK